MKTNWISSLAVALALAVPQGPASAANWTLTLDAPNQVTAPGTTVVYSGTITNGTGVPLSLDGGLDFSTSPEAEQFNIDFAPALLALDLVIPAGGYTGAIFEVGWSAGAIPGSSGVGQLLLSTGAPATPSVLTAAFTLGTPGFGPFCNSGTGIRAGGNSAASNDSTGKPSVVYNNPVAGTLAYARYDGTYWTTTPITSGIGAQASPSLALDGELHPHVAFFDAVAGNLVHAWDPGTGWQTEIVESTGNVGAEPSLVVDVNNELQVSYYDVTNGDLRYAIRQGGVWSPVLVDATADVGRYSAIATDEVGRPYISYYDATSEDLKLARKSGGSWFTEVVDGVGSRGTWTSVKVRSGVVSISYRDATLGSPALRYATGSPGSWTSEAVDAAGDPGFGSSLELNAFGQPRIAYQDATSSEVRFASKSGASWTTQSIGAAGTPLLSLTRSVTDEPFMSYSGASGELRFVSITTCGLASVSDPGAGGGPLLVLHGNRPNPFSGNTTFSFALARASDVRVRVYDTAGRLVAEPYRGAVAAGAHELAWSGTGVNGRRLAPGRYLYEIRSGNETRIGRMVLLR